MSGDEREILINLRFEKADENLKIARLVFDASPNKAASAAYFIIVCSILCRRFFCSTSFPPQRNVDIEAELIFLISASLTSCDNTI